MMAQIRLFGGIVEAEKSEKRNGRKSFDGSAPDGCAAQCYYALEKVCVCRCSGAGHGVGAGLQKLDKFNGDEE